MSEYTQAAVQVQKKSGAAPFARSILQRAAITPTVAHHGILQRCSGGVECAECRAKREARERMQRAAVNTAPVNAVPPIVHDVLNSSGQSLDAGTRSFMEPRFGHDFSNVRVHTDARAAESARSVNALAYTVGRNVVFGTGQYAPGTSEGRRLLAHELTHVVQQQGAGNNTVQEKLVVGQPDDHYEQEADQITEAVVKNDAHFRVDQRVSKEVARLQRRVRFFACNDADHTSVENTLGESVSVDTLRSAVDAASSAPASWVSAAVAALRVSPRSPDIITLFHQSFGADPDWVPPWRPSSASWVDFGDLIATRLERAAGIIDGGFIQYFCWGSPAHCPECRRPPTNYFACSSFLGNYQICLGQGFWQAWQNGDDATMGSTLMHEALHIYFGRTIKDAGRSGNANCYEIFVLQVNGLFVNPATAAFCPVAP